MVWRYGANQPMRPIEEMRTELKQATDGEFFPTLLASQITERGSPRRHTAMLSFRHNLSRKGTTLLSTCDRASLINEPSRDLAKSIRLRL